MDIKFKFAEWLKQEMTSSSSVGGGGGSFTNSIARFSMPLFTSPVKRTWNDEDDKKKKKCKKN